MKEKVEGLVSKSDERPLRVVIDEELPRDSLRILISEMKPAKKADVADFNVWQEEEELYVTRDELAGMLDEKQMQELREGQEGKR